MNEQQQKEYNQLQMELILHDYQLTDKSIPFEVYAMQWIYSNAEEFRVKWIRGTWRLK